MNTRRVIKKITKMQRQLGDLDTCVPRDHLSESYYRQKNNERLKSRSLEEDAREFSLWALGKKKNCPFNPFKDTGRINQIAQYLKSHDYAYNIGRTPKEAMAFGYHFTREGKKWVFEKQPPK